MTNCFQVSGNALVTVVKSLSSVRIFEAGSCETISLNQAQEILETFALSEFSFSPERRPSAMWERFLADYNYIQFGGII